MGIIVTLLGGMLLVSILVDGFETIVLPRRVTRRLRLTRLFYRGLWRPWAALARLLPDGKSRDTYLGYFGPLSLLLLLSVWAVGLIVGFALVHWGMGSPLHAPEETVGFGTDLYLSGTTFFTLGLGDITPRAPLARFLTVSEAGIGFGFLAGVIGYLPVLYQAFSRREVIISLLDARAGSPPSATELVRRHSQDHGMDALRRLLQDWEIWTAELLESHLSYPVLAYYRSQHSHQSWLAALTTMLDSSALVLAAIPGTCQYQARLTFAMARHAVVDLAQIFNVPPRRPPEDRLPAALFAQVHAALAAAGVPLDEETVAYHQLVELRRLYEPYVQMLASYLGLLVPPWLGDDRRLDNWQTSPWEHSPRPSSTAALEEATRTYGQEHAPASARHTPRQS
jgi:ion channel